MIEYEEDWFLRLLLQKEGSVIPEAIKWTLPSLVLTVLLLYLDEWYPEMREDLGLLEATNSHIWSASTGVIVSLISFRTKQGFDRFWEGTGLLHQMRGEWFDTVSNCVTFSIAAKSSKQTAVMKFRHAIIRIMSLCHGSALEEISGNSIELESIDTFGLDDQTLTHLQECHMVYQFNKVEVMLHLLQSLITTALHDGVLQIPPPIASRVYQTISRGFVNLLNAKKIQDTKFPFPYVQLIAFLMVVLEILTPVMMTTIVQSKVLAVVFTFMPIFGLFCLNMVAQELENPFGTDDNDLPLQHFQTEMNNCLMMLLHPNTDLITTVKDCCVMDFHVLREQVCLTLEEMEDKEDGEGAQSKISRQATRRLSHFDLNNPEGNLPPSMSASDWGAEFGATADEIRERASLQGPVDEAAIMNKEDTTTSRQDTPPVPKARISQSSVICYPSDEVYSGQAAVGPPIRARGPSANKDLEDLSVFVGNEPQMDERQSPRMQEPRPMLSMGGAGQRISPQKNNEGLDDPLARNRDPPSPAAPAAVAVEVVNRTGPWQRPTEAQLALVDPAEELVNSLEVWTTNIYREVDAFKSNSAILQKALKKFHDGLPALKAQAKNRRAG